MRIINKPDLKQTLMTTGSCFAAGFVVPLVVQRPWLAGNKLVQYPVMAVCWGLAIAWSVRRMPGARKDALVVFPLLALVGWVCSTFFPVVFSSLTLMGKPYSNVAQLSTASATLLIFWLFSAYYRHKPPLFNYVLALGIGWLGGEIVMLVVRSTYGKMGMIGRMFNDDLINTELWCCTILCTTLAFAIALSLPKPRKPMEILEEEYNLLK